MIALLLMACGEPISNALFYEEEEFLAALPSAERLVVPDALLHPPEGDSAILAASADAAHALDAHLAPLIACGDALREVGPDERGETHRSWALAPASFGTETFWLRAEIVKPDDGAATWTIDAAQDRIGPWHEVGEGRHEASGAGRITWDLDAAAALFDLEPRGVLEIDYLDGEAPRVEVWRYPEALQDPDRWWAVVRATGLGWSGTFDVTGETRIGVAVAVHTEAGGRAEGTLLDDDTPLAFATCWDAAGDRVWLGGDDEIVATGDESACALGPLTGE